MVLFNFQFFSFSLLVWLGCRIDRKIKLVTIDATKSSRKAGQIASIKLTCKLCYKDFEAG